MANTMTPDQWRDIGLQVGRERGLIDLLAGDPRPVDQLWIPAGVDAVYVAALKDGYLEVVGGEIMRTVL